METAISTVTFKGRPYVLVSDEVDELIVIRGDRVYTFRIPPEA